MEVSNHRKSVRRVVEVGDDLLEDLSLQHLRKGLIPCYLIAELNRIHSLIHHFERRYAVVHHMATNDHTKLAVLGACDARTVFGHKFPKSCEVKGLRSQELLNNFLISICVAHISS